MTSIRKPAKHVLTVIDDLLSRVILTVKNPPCGPVFIIGPPRSGTTLLYQLMTSCLDVDYITNMEARHHYAPILARTLRPAVEVRTKDDERYSGYASNHGKTKGPMGPSEAGEFWYRWFPRGFDAPTHDNNLAEKLALSLKRTVGARAVLGKKPLILKNVFNSVRLGALSRVFPESCFVIIERNPIQTAQSILRARDRFQAHRGEFWSVPPPGARRILSRSWEEQIGAQIMLIYRHIEEQKSKIGKGRFLTVEYEALCADPRENLRRLVDFLADSGIYATQVADPPEKFEATTGQVVSEEDYKRLKRALEKYEEIQ